MNMITPTNKADSEAALRLSHIAVERRMRYGP
jgi:hypothetical protein